MKTFPEVEDWCAGAIMEFGDSSVPVCQIFCRWREDVSAIHDEDLACGVLDGEVVLLLGPAFPQIPLRMMLGEPLLGGDGHLEAFGAELVSPGVWALAPSLNVRGLIHAFVVFYGVPDPAPWERRILV